MVDRFLTFGPLIGAFGGALLIRLYAPPFYGHSAMTVLFGVCGMIMLFTLFKSLYGPCKQANGVSQGEKDIGKNPSESFAITKGYFVKAHRLVHLAGIGAVVLAGPGLILVAVFVMWAASHVSNVAKESLQRNEIEICLLIGFTSSQ